MTFDILKMEFLTPLHLGQEGDNVEIIEECAHSDTLFSAICHAWLKMYGKEDLECLLEAFLKAGDEGAEPPFSFSSAFPFVGCQKIGQGISTPSTRREDGKISSIVEICQKATIFYPPTLFYLPKPKMRPPMPEWPKRIPELEEPRKLLKDIDWINKDFFEEWISYHEPNNREVPLFEWQQLKKEEEILSRAMGTEVRPRVVLDEVSGASQLYFFGMIRFSKGSGLYCFIRFNEDMRKEVESKLKAVINLLGDEGLGGERSSGYGTFTPHWDSLDLELPENAEATNGLITLSLWYPNEKDLLGSESDVSLEQYGLIHRAGWTFSPLLKKAYRRKVARMFSEGSTFSLTEPPVTPTRRRFEVPPKRRRNITGCLVDVTPYDLIKDGGHYVYRYGFAFTNGMFQIS
jgi:CRISPR-associated protein Csm4